MPHDAANHDLLAHNVGIETGLDEPPCLLMLFANLLGLFAFAVTPAAFGCCIVRGRSLCATLPENCLPHSSGKRLLGVSDTRDLLRFWRRKVRFSCHHVASIGISRSLWSRALVFVRHSSAKSKRLVTSCSHYLAYLRHQRHVCFAPQSGHSSGRVGCPKSARADAEDAILWFTR